MGEGAPVDALAEAPPPVPALDAPGAALGAPLFAGATGAVVVAAGTWALDDAAAATAAAA